MEAHLVHRPSARENSLRHAARGRPWLYVAENLTVVLLYFALARLSQTIAIPPGNITPIYPAAGFALACMLLRGQRLWPGIWLGQFLGNTWAFLVIDRWDLLFATFVGGCITSCGAVLQAIAGAYLIRRCCGTSNPFTSLVHLFVFIGLASVVCLISATAGVSGLIFGRVLDWPSFGYSWSTWYLGDFVGIVLFFPLIVVWRSPTTRLSTAQITETAIVASLAVLFVLAVVLHIIPLDLACNILLFSALPLLLWASLRIGQAVVAVLVVTICILAAFLTVNGFGPFAAADPNFALVLLQTFMVVIMVTGLSLAISFDQLQRSERSLRATADSLFTLRFAIDQAGDAVFLVSQDGSFEYVNDQVSKLMGYTKEELASKSVFDIDINFPTSTWSEFWQGTTNGGVLYFESNVHHKDRGHVPVAISVNHVTRQGKKLACAIVRDISERKRAEESQKLAEEERRTRLQQEQELLAARVVQQALYPKSPPKISGFDISGAVLPATHACGDYFDFIPTEGGLIVAVGDVASHGLAPALQMTETRGFLRGLLARDSNLVTVVQELNELLVEDMQEGCFLTLLLTKVGSKGGTLEYVGAGHDAWIVAKSGTACHLDSTGLVLGILSDAPVESGNIPPLNTGDMLVIVTDGVIEARSPEGEFFGNQRMLNTVSLHRHLDSHEIVERLMRSVREFAQCDSLEDDVTAVIVKAR
jgi:PAS domain S-box-containing protein